MAHSDDVIMHLVALLHHPRDTLKDLTLAGHVTSITYHVVLMSQHHLPWQKMVVKCRSASFLNPLILMTSTRCSSVHENLPRVCNSVWWREDSNPVAPKHAGFSGRSWVEPIIWNSHCTGMGHRGGR